ncbi:MAG TPA: penicillin acylase family protein, partial [Lacibacter sp.]|nr:penicillin acylase family protein [Lacibacter sp.]
VKPALLHRFQPWYPLLWTDGSIGAITSGNGTAKDVEAFYGMNNPITLTNIQATGHPGFFAAERELQRQVDGSNGFAIAPSRSASGHALLYINPHTTFYFRPEVHMVSEEGLNAYGAVTWGQFFIYQGFNEHCGWMHTSNNVDVSDMYRISLRKNGNGYQYRFDNRWRTITTSNITLRYKTDAGLQSKTITAYFTHHGPLMARRDGSSIAVRHNNRDRNGLIQSWLRTKAKGLDDYKKVMEWTANASNNTVFADNKGNIAYWHGNFVPRRDPSLNWSLVMDGTTSATDWKGLHKWEETVHVINPSTGWIQNCNSTPFTVSGNASPKKENYPRYMAPDGENFRGLNAVRVLQNEKDFTIDKLIATGYNRKLTAFEVLVPALLKAYHQLSPGDSLFTMLQAPVAVLRSWDYQSSEQSIATTLAVQWAELLNDDIRKVYVDEGEADQVNRTRQFAATASPQQLLQPFFTVVQNLKSDFRSWEIPWGAINRFQRLTGSIQARHYDVAPSWPVPFASATWGMLPSFNSRSYPGTVKRYGFSGNSFVCAVELGPKVKAKSVLAGGNSGNPESKHFNDQGEMYTQGQFKEILFYKEDVIKHTERIYRPGLSMNE